LSYFLLLILKYFEDPFIYWIYKKDLNKIKEFI